MNFGAITACPMGLAHTFMAAEALEIAAKKYGHSIKVETRGALGIENALSDEELLKLDALIIAADIKIDKSKFDRFKVKYIEVSTTEAINKADDIIKRAEEISPREEEIFNSDEININLEEDNLKQIDQESTLFINIKFPNVFKKIYRDIMTGMNVLIPFLIVYGVLCCIYSIVNYKIALNLPIYYMYPIMLSVMAGYIAFAIGDKHALPAGMICGFFAANAGAGFICTAFLGFLCGYIVFFLKKFIKLPKEFKVIIYNIVLPVISTLLGLTVAIVCGPVFLKITNAITNNTARFSIYASIIIGVILGSMVSFDMGGFINKIAYIIGIAELVHGPSKIMAAVMAAGMIPAIASGLYCMIFLNNEKEKKKGARAVLLGLCFVTEGAAPIATKNPKKIIPCLMSGSAAAAAISLCFECKTFFPVGGALVIFIPYAVTNLMYYVIALIIGIVISIILLLIMNIKELKINDCEY